MKAHLFFALVTLAASSVSPAQEIRKLTPSELDAAFEKQATPVKRAGTGLPRTRGIQKPAEGGDGAIVEKSRTYTRGARVIILSNGEKAESPYAEIPILFAKGSAELQADVTTQANVALLAKKIKEYGDTGSRFVIEGHASAEGDGHVNQQLSEGRARTLMSALTGSHQVPASYILRSEGRGSRDAKAAADASEKELEQDRKVLAIKEE